MDREQSGTMNAVGYILIVRPEPAGRDYLRREPHYRLRVFLKRMLRDAGFRCTELRPAVEADRASATVPPAACCQCGGVKQKGQKHKNSRASVAGTCDNSQGGCGR